MPDIIGFMPIIIGFIIGIMFIMPFIGIMPIIGMAGICIAGFMVSSVIYLVPITVVGGHGAACEPRRCYQQDGWNLLVSLSSAAIDSLSG
ncbi:hypothetical protein ACFOEZ_20440 [Tianweitania populi]|nr:hypothetical protein [Tianweitania populi]